MENLIHSHVCCCGARTWSLVIGWLQTINSVLMLLAIPVTYCLTATTVQVVKEVYQNGNSVGTMTYDATSVGPIFILVMVLLSIFGLVEFIGGIFLIMGVHQRDLKKITVWKVLRITIAVVSSILALVSLIIVQVAVVLLCSIIYSCFCLWVVGLHQQESKVSNFVYTKEML